MDLALNVMKLPILAFRVFAMEKFIQHITPGLINAFHIQNLILLNHQSTLKMGIFFLQLQERVLRISQSP